MNPLHPPIPGGCVLLARKMLDSDLMHQSPLVVKLWVWLLLKANWKDRDQLRRGQLMTSIAEMQEALSYYAGWRKMVPTKDEVRTAYEALSKATRITTRRTTRGMVITIVNFDTYQDLSGYASHTEHHKEPVTKPTATPHDTEEREVKPTSPESLRLSGLLAELLLKNNPTHRKLSNGKKDSCISRWAVDVDKLLRIDKQSPEMVEQVIIWCQGDDFWKSNILSGAKLREKWDQLTAKMNGKPPAKKRDEQQDLGVWQ